MDVHNPHMGETVVIERDDLQQLLDALQRRGYEIIGPTVRNGVITYSTVETTDEFPIGWTDEQAGGTYRLERRDDDALFGFTVGPHAWKQFLHPPVVTLWSAERTEDGFALSDGESEPPRYAFFGVRACELSTIEIQDRVFMGGPYTNPGYKARRDNAFTVAINCGKAGNTCFCASMGTGPKVEAGYDLALTEVLTPERHYFVAEVGSDAGADALTAVDYTAAGDAEIDAAEAVVAETAENMGRTLDTEGIKDLFYRNYENQYWESVADRCLTCGNCTMVCPTCFCTTVEDVTDLTGDRAERRQLWDSCFTMNFSYVHGGSVRESAKARYRQWITHKLATWIDQFGVSGCVGCGRCITWCPVAIDITEEAAALRRNDGMVAKEAVDENA